MVAYSDRLDDGALKVLHHASEEPHEFPRDGDRGDLRRPLECSRGTSLKSLINCRGDVQRRQSTRSVASTVARWTSMPRKHGRRAAAGASAGVSARCAIRHQRRRRARELPEPGAPGRA